MKKKFLYTALFAITLASCSEQELIEQPSTPIGGTEVQLPADVTSGELLIKFDPQMTDILDRTLKVTTRSGGAMTRSGIPSTDEVLDILGAYHFERIFPVDVKNEERTRSAGLHLWYRVKFDENTDLKEAADRLAKLGEISKVQANGHIKRAYNTKGYRSYISEAALHQKSATRAVASSKFSDPGLSYQWHYINSGTNDFDNKNGLDNGSEVGCDVGCAEAWKKCTGDPAIVVAILDEGVMFNHPDLKGNMWIDEGEKLYADTDKDGNGYKDDVYGYNFVNNTGIISWMEAEDSGHGTHVAGTIAAMNGNNEGVCGIAGGDGPENPGVRIMSCQVFSGINGVTLDAEARAIKYAADNGAVILQCSWGYNSSLANMIEGYSPGPGSEEEWENMYPLEKEALDYFVNNAGSPNGVIDGGLAIFAAGNEYAGMAAFPAAYSKCVSVSAVAADFTPASYSNYGEEVTISAPGGDTEYYNKVGQDDPESWSDGIYSGSVLSTWIQNGTATYGFMDGTSMACPHVSGVAALGLSYAYQQRRHFKASEYVELLKASTKPLDSWYGGGRVKKYYRNHLSVGASLTQVNLSKYIGKMGAGLINAGILLDNIEGKGSDMVVPNVYVAEGMESTLNLAYYYVKGENLTYTCTSSDASIATVTVEGTLMKVSGVKTGATRILVKVSNGNEQTITVTVRKKANDNGWM